MQPGLEFEKRPAHLGATTKLARSILATSALLALVMSASAGAPAGAETIVFRSGADTGGPGSPDTTIHLLKGPLDSGFPSVAFTAANFESAQAGRNAKVTTVDPDWLASLPSDPLARWINQSGTHAAGSSALYSREFFLEGPLNSVKLQLRYAVDCVFSVDSMLSFTPTLQFRVPGALVAGVPYVTAPTTIGGLPTDIPEDFAVTDTLDVIVPAGATYLFAAADDEHFGDNEDPDGDFGLSIRRLCHGAIDVNPISGPVRPGLELAVSPNPMGSRLRFNWATPTAGPVEFSVFDVRGRLIREWRREAGDGLSGVEDISLQRGGPGNAEPGVLFVRMGQNGHVVTEKVVFLSR
jgi:hypothetical protein